MANLQKNVIQIPEKILEHQTCTFCKKYLSYPPTKTYYTGEIKCGRCSEENDFGVVSSFDKVAANITFPCVNRYEGCPNMIEYRNVPEHEKECKGGQYACPICPIGKYTPKSVLHLVDHFKKLHKYNIIKNLVVQINKGSLSEQYYLHYNPQLNVIILIFFRINGNVLSMNISTVGDEPDPIQQQVKLFEKYPEKIIWTSLWRACSSWNDNLKSFDISLNDELELFCVEFLFKESVKWICTSVSQFSVLRVHGEMQEPALKKKPSIDNYSQPSLQDQERKFRNVNPQLGSLEVHGEVQEPALEKEPSIDNMGGTEAAPRPQGYSEPSLQNQERKFRNVNPAIKGTFPRFHLESARVSYREKLKKPIFSSCGKFIVDETGKKLIDMRCSFCENYFPLVDSCKYIIKCLSCSFSLCRGCSLACTRNFCPICFDRMETFEIYRCQRLYYYCRFGCGGCFRGSELGRHDSYCDKSVILGRDRLIITEHFGLNWGANFFPISKLMKTNVFSMRLYYFNNAVSFKKYYIIDKRSFQYIVDFAPWSDGQGASFNIHHEYDPCKYFFTINILENNKLRQLQDCCSLELKFAYYTTTFAIIFKEKD